MAVERRLGGARARFTDRWGGNSAAPFDSLNLADHVGDDPDAVTANRTRVATIFEVPDATWVLPRHVHGSTVLTVDEASELGVIGPVRDEGDGAATNRFGVLLGALGADCAPIAIANDTACAAVHAGWRGAVGGVVEAGVAAVRALGTGPVRAVVGPCICVRHYEFGADTLADIVARVGPEVRGHTESGDPAFDLRGAIRLAFSRADVAGADVEILDICTAESADHFSYRRDGVTGRHGVVVRRA